VDWESHLIPAESHIIDERKADQYTGTVTELRLAPGYLLKEKYRITRVLGVGGMGVVYEATDETLGRRVAIKELQSALASDAITRQRFDNEAKALARIESENIVTVYERFELAPAPGRSPAKFLVMEFLVSASRCSTSASRR